MHDIKQTFTYCVLPNYTLLPSAVLNSTFSRLGMYHPHITPLFSSLMIGKHGIERILIDGVQPEVDMECIVFVKRN